MMIEIMEKTVLEQLEKQMDANGVDDPIARETARAIVKAAIAEMAAQQRGEQAKVH